LSARINPTGIQFPTIGVGVGVLPTKPVGGLSHTFLEHAVRGVAVHDDQFRTCRVTNHGAISFDRHGFGVVKQIDADVGDLEVRQAANGFHGALKH
jgi:hypothetical protein